VIPEQVLPKSGYGFGSNWIWVLNSSQVWLRLELKQSNPVQT